MRRRMETPIAPSATSKYPEDSGLCLLPLESMALDGASEKLVSRLFDRWLWALPVEGRVRRRARGLM